MSYKTKYGDHPAVLAGAAADSVTRYFVTRTYEEFRLVVLTVDIIRRFIK